MSRYFFWKTFFMYAMQIPVQTKVHFKDLLFLAVTYDIGLLRFDVNSAVCFTLFKQFLETVMTWSQPIIV